MRENEVGDMLELILYNTRVSFVCTRYAFML